LGVAVNAIQNRLVYVFKYTKLNFGWSSATDTLRRSQRSLHLTELGKDPENGKIEGGMEWEERK